MKDVSKQTLHDLMTYIYRGEIDVTQANLEDFFITAKALEIKGLIAECPSNAFECQTSTPSWSTSAYNGYQYQASRTILVQNSEKKITPSDSFQSNYYQAAAHESKQHTDLKLDGATVLNENSYGADEHFDSSSGLEMAKENVSMDLKYGDDCNGTWNNDQKKSKSEDFTRPSALTTKKYTKRIYSKRISLSFFGGE